LITRFKEILSIPMLMSDGIRVVELFAGVGGFRVGLERASDQFKTVWANQWEPGKSVQFAFDCYDKHFGNSESTNINDDIGVVKGQVPGEFDLLVGGFPCQDYSVASTNARGIEGKKGVLWWHIRDIIESRRPKYVLLENVDRLLKSPTIQRGRDFGIILRCMADLDYSVEWRVINAADYGFVQKRRRTFIFACKNDQPHYSALAEAEPEERIHDIGFFAQKFPVNGIIVKSRTNGFDVGKSNYKTLVDVSNDFAQTLWNSGVMIGSNVYTRESSPKYGGPHKFLSDIIQDNVGEKYYQDSSLEKWKEMKGSKKIMRKKKGTDFEYLYSEGGIPFPDLIDRPGRTMLTSEGSKNRSSHLIEDPQTHRMRILTPVECERMNGFPDDWTDGMSDSQRYFTMGNALVVDLIEQMGKTILDYEI